MTKYHIIDTLGPFAAACDRPIYNWSKVPFSKLEARGRLSHETQQRIIKNFEPFIEKIVNIGYDSISIDDLAHLATFPFYRSELQTLLEDYRALYKTLFGIAKKHNLNIFLTTDYLFHNNDIDTHLKQTGTSSVQLFSKALEIIFHDYPEVDGIILRIGENDGKDVTDVFLSRLALKTPHEARNFLQDIVPLFETYNKTLIFRTWTVGVYQLGDLIWNEATYNSIFGPIKSDSLIISMKFGDTDFMRYLSLNPLFFASNHRKIIELQTRREWEGMGTYPSFTGWDYERYVRELGSAKNIVGISVWCQTGGWASEGWINCTYLSRSSLWNELNTETTLRIYKYNETADKAIASFCADRSIVNTRQFTKLLHKSEIVIKQGLYIKELAEKTLYFRRTRIPPLMGITWNKVLTSPLVILFIRASIKHPDELLMQTDQAVKAAQEMRRISTALKLDDATQQSLEFIYDTIRVFKGLRLYILTPMSRDEVDILNSDIARYTERYPQHYIIPKLYVRRKQRFHFFILGAFIRTHKQYRLYDQLILWLSPVQRMLLRIYLKATKSDLKNQSMGIESLFK